MKHQMDIDEQVYYGDVNGATGMTNNRLVTNVANVANGAMGTPAWTTKTPAEILADVNTALATTWANAAWAVIPDRLMLPPAQYSYISTQLVSAAGTVSILKYLEDNNIVAQRGKKLAIYPLKVVDRCGRRWNHRHAFSGPDDGLYEGEEVCQVPDDAAGEDAGAV